MIVLNSRDWYGKNGDRIIMRLNTHLKISFSGGSRRVSEVSIETLFWNQKKPFRINMHLTYINQIIYSYLETVEIFSTYVRQCGCTFLILDTSFLQHEFIRIAHVVIFMKRKSLDISCFSKKDAKTKWMMVS